VLVIESDLLMHETRYVDGHFEVDSIIQYETTVEQLLELHELGKPCHARHIDRLPTHIIIIIVYYAIGSVTIHNTQEHIKSYTANAIQLVHVVTGRGLLSVRLQLKKGKVENL